MHDAKQQCSIVKGKKKVKVVNDCKTYAKVMVNSDLLIVTYWLTMDSNGQIMAHNG